MAEEKTATTPAAAVLRCFAPNFRVVKRKRVREWVTLLLRQR